jgi:hypothetical protein
VLATITLVVLAALQGRGAARRLSPRRGAVASPLK